MHRIEWSWMGTGLYYLLEVWWHKMIAFETSRRVLWHQARFVETVLVTLSFIALMALGFGVLGYARTHSIFGVALARGTR